MGAAGNFPSGHYTRGRNTQWTGPQSTTRLRKTTICPLCKMCHFKNIEFANLSNQMMVFEVIGEREEGRNKGKQAGRKEQMKAEGGREGGKHIIKTAKKECKTKENRN